MAVDPNRESTFGRELMRFVSSNIPYTGYRLIDRIAELNPKFETFYDKGAKQQENLINKSVATSVQYDEPAANVLRNKEYYDFMYANVQPDKGKRVMEYRVMAAFSEVADALDEICDECINIARDGSIANLVFKDPEIKSEYQDTLKAEWNRYSSFFELNKKGWEYFRQLLVDAEVFFENIIHRDHPDKGVLGVVSIPTDVVDPIYSNVQNMLVKGFLLRKPIFDSKNPNKVKEIQIIPLDQNQVVYINSGIWNENKTLRLPFIENARRAYRQLSLIEDSIVIYRLVNAPERLVFNIDVGNMSPPKAEAYLRRLMTQYWSKRTFDGDQNTTVNKFNPQSMLDAYWFAKRTGSEGTSVTKLQGGMNLGQLDDLLYFVKKLYKSLKVPVTRVNPENTYNDGEGILREELKFARFIIRLQQRVAAGIKPGFITHLKLKGIWDKLNLREHTFEIEFNVPSNFYELRENQKLQLKFESYNNISQNEFISKTYAQKKYLGWNDHDILANREFLRKDAEFTWELDQIKGAGPNWKSAGAAAAPAGAGAAGAPPAGGSAIPPAFGPAPGAGAEPEEGAGAEAGAAGGAPGAEAAGGGGAPPAFGAAPAGGAPAA
jgi:hypothetical protein